ncbi:hypothetical protein C8F04DRAFT_492901 [Mycena alexandri]|uniref:F-box domain-containing protein n=1 Tax=Mycena alexandri TaxID=1745969 RepID=A0AAD6RXS0_9AGAR|nr:hypothetical protein C8F04DRAFT_492901 [Mycena alexandri]
MEIIPLPGALAIDVDTCVPIIHGEPTLDQEHAIASRPLPLIHTLAFEMLAEIMVLALAPRIGPNGRSEATARDVQRLCQVCSYWREVAVKTARLWTTIPLPIMTWDWQVAPSPTKMFLERSAPLPIPVCILPIFIEDSDVNLVEISPMVSNISDRWRTFKVMCPWDKFDVASLARISSLKNLESLHLKWTKPESWHGSELDAFLHAPRLRDVRIEVPLATSNILSMPWAQLTRLSLTYDSPQLCLDVLSSCTKLVTAYVNTKQWLESDSPDDSYVARSGLLAHLTELRIHSRIYSTGETLGPFLRRFRLPALKTLDLNVQLSETDDDTFVDRLTPALTFLLAQSPNLHCLRLGNGSWGSFYAEDMPDILHYTPNLTELVLSMLQVDDNFFEALRYAGPNTTPLVPELDTLVLMDVGESFEEASFGDMIRSRWWSDVERLAMLTPPIVTRLKHIKFWNQGLHNMADDFKGFTAELVDTMREYCSQGLDLTGSNYFPQTSHHPSSPSPGEPGASGSEGEGSGSEGEGSGSEGEGSPLEDVFSMLSDTIERFSIER